MSRKIEYGGNLYSINALSKLLGIRYETLRNRIDTGWPKNRWGEKTKQDPPKVMYKGESWSRSQLAKKFGVRVCTLSARINNGWPEEEWGLPTKERLPPIEYKGKMYHIPDLADELGVSRNVLSYRINRNWPQEDWDLPVGPYTRHTAETDETYSGYTDAELIEIYKGFGRKTDRAAARMLADFMLTSTKEAYQTIQRWRAESKI